MRSPVRCLSPSEAARRLGVSAKALRLYEQRGLVNPARTAAGWRAYSEEAMARAAQVVALRALGFSLAQAARLPTGSEPGLEQALAAHQEMLEGQLRRLSHTVEQVRGLRISAAGGATPTLGELAGRAAPISAVCVAFDLPWPWGGERFELRKVRALTYIVGPLGSGKTRLAHGLAAALPNAALLGLDRLEDGGAAAGSRLESDPGLRSRVDRVVARLVEEGAVRSGALVALLAGLEADGPDALVVDMIEQGLDQRTQEVLIAWLRRRGPQARPIFMLTRSSAILDLSALASNEAVIFCPANHSPPTQVGSRPGGPGYEAVATCLASPEVRARTAGVIAWRQPERLPAAA